MTGKDDLKLALRFLRSIDTQDPKLNAEIQMLAKRIEELLNQMNSKDGGDSDGKDDTKDDS